MGKYFGTDGFRGEANVTLTADHAYRVGRYLGSRYKRIVIGKDTRRSSYMFEYALSAGITASGADAYLLHVTTTPSVAYVTKTEEFDCGVMISASHNPYYDNGIKLLNGQGEKMDEETILDLESYLDGDPMQIPYATGSDIGRTVDYVSGRNRYVGYLISLGRFSFKNLRIGLDCANGAAWNIAPAVFQALGAKTYVINDTPDGTNINLDAGSTHIERLQAFVKEKGLDAGFAFDGDADRCLCVDELGNVVTGDHILYLLATDMKQRRQLEKDTVVTTVMSNLGLYQALDKAGICYTQTPVGDKYVWAEMAQKGYSLGGEQSGHIIISRYATTGDGILTALKVMEAMLEKKEPLSKLCQPMKTYPQLLKNVKVADKAAAMEKPNVKQAVQAAAEALGDRGRVLLRPSGTEPVLRIMVEAETEDLCNSWIAKIEKELS